jgi:hypothetical protein
LMITQYTTPFGSERVYVDTEYLIASANTFRVVRLLQTLHCSHHSRLVNQCPVCALRHSNHTLLLSLSLTRRVNNRTLIPKYFSRALARRRSPARRAT